MSEKDKILDVAMNLNRVGNWAADGYKAKQKRIVLFLNQTTQYLNLLDTSNLPQPLKTSLSKFQQEYSQLKKEGLNGPKDPVAWAERMMTWGNILTHRAQLIQT